MSLEVAKARVRVGNPRPETNPSKLEAMKQVSADREKLDTKELEEQGILKKREVRLHTIMIENGPGKLEHEQVQSVQEVLRSSEGVIFNDHSGLDSHHMKDNDFNSKVVENPAILTAVREALIEYILHSESPDLVKFQLKDDGHFPRLILEFIPFQIIAQSPTYLKYITQMPEFIGARGELYMRVVIAMNQTLPAVISAYPIDERKLKN